MKKAKSFNIPKPLVIEAWKRVRGKGGSAGVDGITIEEIEMNLRKHLYKLWNRLSSGSYFPPPVKLVEIPKKSGGKRPLGIPTVMDRVAQMIVKMELEPLIDPYFHRDSYGYRPGKREQIEKRLHECKLKLHPEKTKIVFCKRSKRKGKYPNRSFDFLGFTFRPRKVISRTGQIFIGFVPGISNKSRKSIHQEIKSWRLHLRSSKSIDELSHIFNPILRGWFGYYGKFRKSALYRTFSMFQRILEKWAMKKFKSLKKRWVRANKFINRIMEQKPELFVHWGIWKDGKERMIRAV